MRFLFTVQGEGRGHFTQALSLASMLRKHGHEVIAVLVGKSDLRQIPTFFSEKIKAPVFDFRSPNFMMMYRKKRPNIFFSVVANFMNSLKFRKSILFVKSKIEEYRPDVVVNFYEMITAMAFSAYRFDKKTGVRLISVAHQYVLLNPNYKTTAEQDIKYYFLRMMNKITSRRSWKILALSFRDIPRYKNIVTVPPLLRHDVFEMEPVRGNYIHGYMLNQGYYGEVLHWHKNNPDVALRFFWDKKDAEEVTVIDENLVFYRLNDRLFLESMAGCMAYSTTSGFESICEALYYRKPVLMIPVHIEQEFNAFDASLSGAGISSSKFDLTKLLDFTSSYCPDENFRDWVSQAEERFLKEILEEK